MKFDLCHFEHAIGYFLRELNSTIVHMVKHEESTPNVPKYVNNSMLKIKTMKAAKKLGSSKGNSG